MSPHLVWIHQNFVTRRQAGNSRAVLQVAALLERGWRVDVITGPGSYLERRAPPRPYSVTEEGQLRIHRLASRGARYGYANRQSSYINFVWNAFKLAATLGTPDVFFASSPPLPQVLPSLLLAALKRRPLVFEARDLWPAMLVETGLLARGGFSGLLAVLEASTTRYASRCICATPGFERYFQSLGVPFSKLEVIPTGSDLVFAKKRSKGGAEWRAIHDLQEKFVIVYAGSLNEHYGVSDIVEAAEFVHERNAAVTWVICGDGRDRALISKAAQDCSYLLDLGPIPKEELRPLFEGSDLALVSLVDFPLFRSILPGKLFDYMAAGLPIVSNVAGHTDELLKRSGAGRSYLPERKGSERAPEVLARGVLEMSSMPSAELARMGCLGSDWVAGHLNGHAMARRWALTLEKVMSLSLPSDSMGLPGMLRLIRSLGGGFADVMKGRHEEAVEALAGPEDGHEACRLLADWLIDQPDQTEESEICVPDILETPVEGAT